MDNLGEIKLPHINIYFCGLSIDEVARAQVSQRPTTTTHLSFHCEGRELYFRGNPVRQEYSPEIWTFSQLGPVHMGKNYLG